MTHQEIATAFETIYQRAREVAKAEREWVNEERERLRSECATIGHIWGRDFSALYDCGTTCVVCHAPSTGVQSEKT